MKNSVKPISRCIDIAYWYVMHGLRVSHQEKRVSVKDKILFYILPDRAILFPKTMDKILKMSTQKRLQLWVVESNFRMTLGKQAEELYSLPSHGPGLFEERKSPPKKEERGR